MVQPQITLIEYELDNSGDWISIPVDDSGLRILQNLIDLDENEISIRITYNGEEISEPIQIHPSDYVIEIFSEDDEWDWEAAGRPGEVEVLVVAGGGGGAIGTNVHGGGGGGSGGIIHRKKFKVHRNMDVKVGKGGKGGEFISEFAPGMNAQPGENSSFGDLTAIGGGGGGQITFAPELLGTKFGPGQLIKTDFGPTSQFRRHPSEGASSGGSGSQFHVGVADPLNCNVEGIQFLNEKVAIAVGSRGIILRSEDGGETWEEQLPGTTVDMLDVSFFNENEGCVVGSTRSTILKTTDGGKNWTDVSIDTQSFRCNSVFFVNETHGWASTLGGRVYRTTNGGSSWTGTGLISSLTNTDHPDIFFVSTSTGWIVDSSGRIRRSTNGGGIWVEQKPFGGGRLNGLHFYDIDLGWAVGENGRIYKTTNSGSTWTQITNIDTDVSEIELRKVNFIDDENGVIVGDMGTVLITNDGGESWETVIMKNKQNLRAVHLFFNDENESPESPASPESPEYNFSICVTGNNGTIYISHDSGNTWENKPDGVPHQGNRGAQWGSPTSSGGGGGFHSEGFEGETGNHGGNGGLGLNLIDIFGIFVGEFGWFAGGGGGGPVTSNMDLSIPGLGGLGGGGRSGWGDTRKATNGKPGTGGGGGGGENKKSLSREGGNGGDGGSGIVLVKYLKPEIIRVSSFRVRGGEERGLIKWALNNQGESITAIEYELDNSGTWVSTGSTDPIGEFSISGLTNDEEYSVRLKATIGGDDYESEIVSFIAGPTEVFENFMYSKFIESYLWNWEDAEQPSTIDVLVVAGGGAAGTGLVTSTQTAGAGGGGGLIFIESYSVSENKEIIVGRGGWNRIKNYSPDPPTYRNISGYPGENSIFGNELIAIGGGAGSPVTSEKLRTWPWYGEGKGGSGGGGSTGGEFNGGEGIQSQQPGLSGDFGFGNNGSDTGGGGGADGPGSALNGGPGKEVFGGVYARGGSRLTSLNFPNDRFPRIPVPGSGNGGDSSSRADPIQDGSDGVIKIRYVLT